MYKATHIHRQTLAYSTIVEPRIFVHRKEAEFASQLQDVGCRNVEIVATALYRKNTGYEGRDKRLAWASVASPCLCTETKAIHIHLEIRARANGVSPHEAAKAIARAAVTPNLL